MAPTKKSIYRGPDAQHFQLVHRSVRDPLALDPDANQQVFKAMGRANAVGKTSGSGKVTTMAELAVTEGGKMRANEGEAATYGITYDDSTYDYMQHLKAVGEGGGDSVLLSAPRGSGVATGMKNQGQREKGKGKARNAEDMFQLPEDALPSRYEMSVAEVHASKLPVPPELQGLQPDMDPHLRQVLEALDDEAFIEDDGEEDGDVFGELLHSGELGWDEEPEEFEFAEWGVNEDGTPVERKVAYGSDDDDAKTENGEKVETWEDRFRAFKAAGGKHPTPVSNGGWDSDEAEEEGRSEAADTVGSLSSQFKDMMVKGGKKRHGKRGPSDASGMSMSSASVYRNQNLRDLDARFDRLEREYELDDDDEYIDDDYDDDVSIAPSYMSTASRVSMFSKSGGGFVPGSPPKVTRDDFDAIMDDFLDKYEVVGRRMREAVGSNSLSGPEKLRVLRAALEEGEDGIGHDENRRRILELERLGRGIVKEDKDILRMEEVQPDKEKWDVETILSTYTNTENHPGMIRMRSAAEAQKRAERRAAAAEIRAAAAAAAERAEQEDDSEGSGSETERETTHVTVTRPKGESAAEKKARKAAVKEQRASRRAEKKAHTKTFGDERKRQMATHAKAVGGGRAADVSVTRGVIRM